MRKKRGKGNKDMRLIRRAQKQVQPTSRKSKYISLTVQVHKNLPSLGPRLQHIYIICNESPKPFFFFFLEKKKTMAAPYTRVMKLGIFINLGVGVGVGGGGAAQRPNPTVLGKKVVLEKKEEKIAFQCIISRKQGGAWQINDRNKKKKRKREKER